MNNYKYLLGLMVVIFLGSCQEKVVTEVDSLAGKYITKIERNIIYFEDGTDFKMKDSEYFKSFYLVRHSEKDSIPVGNPYLSKEGEARSRRLAEILKGVQIDAVYSTITNRTLFTVDSICDIKGLPTLPYTNSNLKETVEEIRSSLDKHNVLIVGHSNTIPVLANHLIGEKYYNETFEDDDYENLLIVFDKSDSTKTFLPLKFK